MPVAKLDRLLLVDFGKVWATMKHGLHDRCTAAFAQHEECDLLSLMQDQEHSHRVKTATKSSS